MAGATELFRLSARLVLDTDGFDAGIASAREQVQRMGSVFDGAESRITKLSSAMNVAKGVADVAVKALKKGFDIGKELVGTAASIKALDESMAVTFEGIEERAAAAFKAVSEENNIAERRLQESGIAFFRQFSGAGMDSANAMMNMENALQLAADAAAAYDISLEDASSMIRSFVRGNVEAGESIGVFVNEQKRNELAFEEFGKKWKDLNEAERQFLLLDLVEQTYKQNKVLGQGAREADNYANVVGNLASAWNDAMGKMGEKALPNVTETLQELADWVSRNSLVFETLGSWFGDIASIAGDAAIAVMSFAEQVSVAAEKSGWAGVIDTLVGKEGYTGNIVDKWTTMRDLVNGKDKSATIGDVVDAIADAGLSLVGKELNIPEVQAEPEDTAEAKMQRVMDTWNLVVSVKGRWAGWNAGGPGLADTVFFDDNNGGAGQFARGLDRVPYDKFPAWLDRDESVLNRVEAEDWRASKRGKHTGFDPEAIGNAVKAALAGVNISMDGRTVGALVTPHVSREQAAEAWRRR